MSDNIHSFKLVDTVLQAANIQSQLVNLSLVLLSLCLMLLMLVQAHVDLIVLLDVVVRFIDLVSEVLHLKILHEFRVFDTVALWHQSCDRIQLIIKFLLL